MFPSRQPSYPACVGGPFAALVATMEVCRGRNGSRTAVARLARADAPRAPSPKRLKRKARPKPGMAAWNSKIQGRRSIGYTSNGARLNLKFEWKNDCRSMDTSNRRIGVIRCAWRMTRFILGEVPSLPVSGNSQHLKQHGIQPIGRRLICVCLKHIALTRLFYCGSNVLHCVPWCASELRNLIKHNVDLLTMYIYIYHCISEQLGSFLGSGYKNGSPLPGII